MRILVISDLFPPVARGGYELECAALVQRLRTRHEVVVLTSDLGRDGISAEPGVRRVLPFVGGARLRAMVRAPHAAVQAAGRTRRVLDELRPELVYVSNGVTIPQAAIVVAASDGVPVVCRFSELWYARCFLLGDRFLRELTADRRGPRAAVAAVARTTNRHPDLRLPARPCVRATISWASAALRDAAGTPTAVQPTLERVIHPASPHAEAFARLERRPQTPTTIAYVGRVTTAKGAEVGCRALAVLGARHGIEARLVYAGACSRAMRRRLSHLARTLGVGGQVTVAGMLDRDRLGALVAGAGAVLIPTVDFDALPLAAVEAALARAPVVASRVGGIPEALTDDEHALLFEPGDPVACAAALARTLEDRAGTAARVDRAFDHMRRFSLDAYLDASERLIADAA